MNYSAFVPLISAIINIAMASYVLAKDSHNSVNKAFLLIAAMYIGWGMTDFLLWIPLNSELLYPIARLQTIFYTLAGFAFTHFSYKFLRRRYDIVYFTIGLVCLAAAAFGLFSSWMVSGVRPTEWGTTVVGGPLYLPFAICAGIIPDTYALVLLLIRRKTTKEELERKQLNYYLIGIVVAMLVSYCTVVVLAQIMQIHVFPQIHTGGMIFLAFVFFAITKYNFFTLSITTVAHDLFSSAKDGVALLSNNRVIQFNTQAEKLLGSCNISEQLELFAKNCTKETLNGELEEVVKIGPITRTFSTSCFPIIESGVNRGVVLIFRDISRQKQAEVEINKMNIELSKARDSAIEYSKTKSRFLANMSHEIRTPLTSILGYAEILNDISVPDEERKIIIKTITDNGEHLLQVINEILDISKIEENKLNIENIPFSPLEIIQNIREIYKPLIENKNLSFNVNIEFPQPELIISDPTRFRQILLNLLSNAAKFTSSGFITLASRFDVAAKLLIIEVIDTGIGLSKEQADNLFEPFTQADITTTRKYGGTGLGLSICKRLTSMLNGSLRVKSELGSGSCFTLTLNCNRPDNSKLVYGFDNKSSESSTVVDASKNTYDWSHKNILLAEDSTDIQKLVALYLRKTGVLLTIANNGQEAVDLALAMPFDVILMDMQMPIKDGYCASEELRRHNYNFPILALSANVMKADQRRYEDIGINGFLAKPIKIDEFFKSLDRYLTGVDDDEQPNNQLDDEEKELFEDLIEDFKQQLPGKIMQMRTALEHNKLEELTLIAHTLKGLGGSFGYPVITKLSLVIEKSSNTCKLDQVKSSINALDSYCKRNIIKPVSSV